jgi:hypothetical protein
MLKLKQEHLWAMCSVKRHNSKCLEIACAKTYSLTPTGNNRLGKFLFVDKMAGGDLRK